MQRGYYQSSHGRYWLIGELKIRQILEQVRDARKTESCSAHAINLQWISYFDYDFINPEYLKLNEFLER